ncbi:MAG: two-component system, NarL family, response regulator DesR [Chloroflexota bacterium]|jgi:two-component system response regulator DesR|nr:two-component system, NarL family, response regulator DesR [Chloroflexota bacterium]
MIRVLLAEDQTLLREALASILAHEDDLEVVGELSRGDGLVEAVDQLRPDVVLVDIEMPGTDGLTATERLHAHRPECRVIILTVYGRPGYLDRAMRAGAAGFILKDASPADLVGAIRRVVAGERVIDPRLAVATAEHGRNPLTPREREILALSASGATAADVALSLGLSEGTVRNHLSVAIHKLESRTKVEAARTAEERGWL